MTIVFDLDGTLIDVSDRHYSVYRDTTISLQGKPLTKEVYWQMKKSKKSWQEILNQSKVEESTREQFMERFIRLIESPEMTQLDTIIDGAKEVLSMLREKGHTLFLVSLRRNNDALMSELEHLELKQYFKEAISGHTDGEGFELKKQIIKELVNDSETLVVGDTEADVLAAKQLKCHSVAVLSGIRSEQILAELRPDYLISSVIELPQIISSLS